MIYLNGALVKPTNLVMNGVITMKDEYKKMVEHITNQLDRDPNTPFNKAGMLLDLIKALIIIYLVLVKEDRILLFVDVRHIDDSIMKARYN